jgi:hypothetical protein
MWLPRRGARSIIGPMEGAPEVYDAAVAELADVAREFGHQAGRHWFSGVVPDHENAAITVYRVPNPGFDSELLTLLAGDVAVRLADAPPSRDELLVARDQAWGLADLLPITAISIPPNGTRITVVADAASDVVQAELDRVAPGLATVLVERVATA